MIHRFKTKQIGSGRRIEVQLQAPAGASIEKMSQGIRTSFAQQGINVGSLRYAGSIDTDFEGIVEAGCATPGCEKPVDNAGDYCAHCRTVTLDSWYVPSKSGPQNSVCVVSGCGQPSTFHLCANHAIPGMIVEVRNIKFVISTWLVERNGREYLITLNDFALGDLFENREAFEERLRDDGYKVHNLLSCPDDLFTIRSRDPEISVGPWIPAVDGGFAEPHEDGDDDSDVRKMP